MCHIDMNRALRLPVTDLPHRRHGRDMAAR